MAMTQSRVRELFDYREDGNLIWKKTTGSFGVKGSVAGTMRPDGKKSVSVDGRMQLLHRVIFLWHHGWLPEYLDHKDTDKLNNRIDNLRPATKSQNGFNRQAPSSNTSGVKGVYWSAERGKWCAEICANKKRIRLGRFDTIEAAKAAYAEAALAHHGGFARVA